MSKYKRSIFIVNPSFQYKFSFFVCFLVFVTSLIYPATIIEVYDTIAAMQPSKSTELLEMRDRLLWLLALIEFSLLGIIFVISIFISHRIAGPIYKLKQYLKSSMTATEFQELNFRKGDYFTDLAQDVNNLMESIYHQREEDFQYLDEVSDYIANIALVVPEDKKPVIEEIISKLAVIRTRRHID